MKVRVCGVLLAAGILLLCGPACSTLMTVGKSNRYLYSGTCENIHAFDPQEPAHLDGVPGNPTGYAFHTPPFIAFLDFPCSRALDTVLVPITLPMEWIHGGSPPPPPEPAIPPKKD